MLRKAALCRSRPSRWPESGRPASFAAHNYPRNIPEALGARTIASGLWARIQFSHNITGQQSGRQRSSIPSFSFHDWSNYRTLMQCFSCRLVNRNTRPFKPDLYMIGSSIRFAQRYGVPTFSKCQKSHHGPKLHLHLLKQDVLVLHPTSNRMSHRCTRAMP